jgi:hypothetical protein
MLWSNTNESAVYRLYNPSTDKHAYAVSADAVSSLQASGYVSDTIVGYQCTGSSNDMPLDVENSLNLVRPMGNPDIPDANTAQPTILYSNGGGDYSMTILKNAGGTDTVLSNNTAEVNAVNQYGFTVVATVQMCNQGSAPVYRLFDPAQNTHFYTSSSSEADVILTHGFVFEGLAFYNAPNSTNPVFRLFDPVRNTHFYTASPSEVAAIQRYGFKYEGVAWTTGSSSNPVFRLYDPVGNTHFYTATPAESNAIQAYGFKYEGVAWDTK